MTLGTLHSDLQVYICTSISCPHVFSCPAEMWAGNWRLRRTLEPHLPSPGCDCALLRRGLPRGGQAAEDTRKPHGKRVPHSRARALLDERRALEGVARRWSTRSDSNSFLCSPRHAAVSWPSKGSLSGPVAVAMPPWPNIERASPKFKLGMKYIYTPVLVLYPPWCATVHGQLQWMQPQCTPYS